MHHSSLPAKLTAVQPASAKAVQTHLVCGPEILGVDPDYAPSNTTPGLKRGCDPVKSAAESTFGVVLVNLLFFSRLTSAIGVSCI